MSNKDVAIYMIPAGCVFAAAVTLESRTVLAIVLLIVAGIVVYAKKKTSARRQAKADVNFANRFKLRAHYSIKVIPYGREN